MSALSLRSVPLSFSFIATALALVACSSEPTEESPEADEGALSVQACNARADDAVKKHISACESDRNLAVRAADACRNSANTPYEAFLADLEKARAAVDELKSTEVDKCIAELQERRCEGVVPNLASALTSSDYGIRGAAERACSLARRTEINKCASARGELVDKESAAAKAWKALDDQSTRKYVEWKFALTKCWWGDTAESTYAVCKGGAANRVRSTEFAKCRRECPAQEGVACVPEAYAARSAACGEVAKSFLGGTCDCTVGRVCKEFDTLMKEKDGKLCTLSTDTEAKVWVVKLGADSAGKAAVRADCVPAKDVVFF